MPVVGLLNPTAASGLSFARATNISILSQKNISQREDLRPAMLATAAEVSLAVCAGDRPGRPRRACHLILLSLAATQTPKALLTDSRVSGVVAQT